MRDSDIKIAYIEDLFNELYHPDHENSPCQGIENVSIFVNKKRWKKRKKHYVFAHAQQPSIAFRLSRFNKTTEKGIVTRHSSMPELSKCTKVAPPRIRSGHGNDTKHNYKKNPFQSKFIANVFSEHRFDNWFLNPNYPSQTKWKIYRCQLGVVEDSCCCNCNSDAMFEVMKSLYDCYKAKNCDGCECVLCGYKTREERKLGELRKSLTSTAREKLLEGKTPEEKEFILKEMAKTRQPLPSGKTASDKALIDKTRKDLGLPPSPKTASEKAKMRKAEAAGIITPLEGKTHDEKEKILSAQADMGLKLPEGRTDSEKALIDKIKAKKKSTKSALLTPLSGKTPEEKEKIVRGRAMKGLSLPEGKTASEKKMIDKVRADLGLPPEPTTKSLREKHDQAAKVGLLEPLEGKTPAQKEAQLKGLRDMGIPLPEGRTPSEKALIAKVKASPRSIVSPSEQLRRAKAEGLITPLSGKTPAQKEKILKGLAMKGLPLPEGKTPSDKKMIDKVRADLGLPPEPTTKSLRDKHEQAAKAGLLGPLEGKTPAQKEAQLKGLRDLGVPLPEGRTPSEKALIAKVKASPRSIVSPSEQLRRAKAEGLITPLSGKTPAQKDKILKGLAMKGLPLPEGKTPSEKKMIDKVRADLGLPPEPTTKSLRDKHEQAAKAGLLGPLEGKTPAQKEAQLKGLRDLGVPLPEGRTPSEKALIAKVKASPRSIVSPSEQLRRAKAEGLITPLSGKTPAQKDKILKGLAMKGLPLPEGKTPSEKQMIDKVRADFGLPPEPTTKSLRDKHEQAAKAGLLGPLEGKTPAQKEAQLKGLRDLGIPLPEGRTPSEKALIAKVKASPRSIVSPSEQLRRAKAEGLITPLSGKTPAQKDKILKGLAMKGLPLPEGKTPSEKKMIDKVRADLGLPPEPTTKSLRDKHEQAARAGLLGPLEGKTPAQKEAQLKGLRDLGVPLPEGRTPSEKALIAKVKASPRSIVSPSEQLRRAKAEGLITPLSGKTPAQKDKILKGLAMKGLPLPEGKTPSEKQMIDKVRADFGLPPEPTTKSLRDKHEQAAKAGLLGPLEGKTPAQKEAQLKGLRDLGIPLPEGRTPSEKALIAKVKASPRSIVSPSEQLRRAKAEGLMTPLSGKTPAQKDKILRGRAMKGIPLPEGKTPSEKKMIDKVRADLGLPPEPTTKSLRDKHELAAKAGLLAPLEGKTPAQKEAQLKGLRDLGVPLPEGRTPSEKALIAKVKASPRSLVSPSEQLRRAKAEGLITPLSGKTPAQKDKILKGLAMKGLPLPEGKTPSEKKMIDKVRADFGLPPEPTTKSLRDKHEQAAKAGLLGPLEGKTPAQKEAQLKGLRDLGIPLPEGRTPSEKALIAKVKASPRSLVSPSEQLRRAKAEGLMTPLSGKTPAQKEKILRGRAMKGIPLPEGVSPSEKKIIDKVRADLGLPPEPTTKSLRGKHELAAKAGLLGPLEGKTPAQKEAQLKGLRDLGVPLPEGRTPSEKALIAKVKATPRSIVSPSEQLRRAKAEGLITPLSGKTPAQKDKILKGLAMKGLPLPEGKTPSEKQMIDKVRADFGLPPEPTTKSLRDKHEQAAKAGLLGPLEGKTPAQKEAQLKGLRDLGIPLPEGRTPSEKALIAKVKASPRSLVSPSEQLRRAKAEGLITPLSGKTPAQKDKILKGLAMKGLPLPEGKTPSEKQMIDKVRADFGLPPEPTTKSLRDKHEQAAKAGLLGPLEGKTPAQKEAQLKGLRDLGIPLPEGRTPSEKALIAKVKASPRSIVSPSEQLRRAKAEGLITPLSGKTPAQKDKILKGLAMKGLPLPEGKTPSEKQMIDKVRADFGLPPEPTTKSLRDKHEQAAKAGLLGPLEGKTPAQKEAQLKGLRDLGIPLPEGRTPSEKALIAKVKASPRSIVSPSEQLRRAKAEGLMTPLSGKTPAQKDKILRGRAMKGIPLPEGKTPSEKKIIDKVRADLGLPPEPTTKSLRDKQDLAAKAGLLGPLEGKTPAQKEAQLKGLRDLGVPLPEGRTPSEKALIAKVKATPRSLVSPSEQLRRAKAEGLITPLSGKTPAQKEKILKGLAMKGLPLPEGKTPSDKKLIDKVRFELGLPKEPDTKSIRDKHEQASKAGFLQPLMGKTPEEKEKILQAQHDLGIPLPEGRTPSEKSLIAKVKAGPRLPITPSEQMRRAKAEGLFTPLKGKTPEQKEKILQGLAKAGLPLPEGKTPSDKALIDKVKKEFGVPEITPSEKLRRAKAAGLFTPLEGKTKAQKENILRGRAAAGLPLPVGKTPSEKSLIKKIKDQTGYVTPSPSEKLKKAKIAGLLTPLKGKSPSMKAKILQGLKAAGVPIPEGETPSEKKLISQIISKPEMALEGIPSDKLKAAKAAGLLTPLEGKTPAEKEKIIKGLIEAGLPVPEGKTKSEKSMISKIRARTPPEGTTPSEKSIIGKAKAAGLFTPITGKAPAEKERILKGLAEAGLPLPEGKTASEKELVKKVRAEAGLPPEATPSEKKGKIRKKAQKAGVSASKRAAGISAEEFEEAMKTTKCDRACGCDRKKIRFKHSYVKIKVTSPDISSFCDCPGECFPQVKNGAFIDSDGIKVTVGSAVGIPSYSMVCINQLMPDAIVSHTDVNTTHTNYNVVEDTNNKLSSLQSSRSNNRNKGNDNSNVTISDISFSSEPYNARSENNNVHKAYRGSTSLKDLALWEDIYKQPLSNTKSASSFDTILIIRNDMSLSTSTSNSMETISLTSVMNSSITSSSAYYSGYQSTNDLLSINSLDGLTTSDDFIDHPAIRERNAVKNIAASQRYTILRMSQLENNFENNKMEKSVKEPDDPIVLFNNVPIELDVSKIMFKIMSKKCYAGASSIFIAVPNPDDEEDHGSTYYADSVTSMRSSECRFTANTTNFVDLGKSLCWLHLKKFTESTADANLQCVGPSGSPIPPCVRCLQGRSEQQQTTISPTDSSCFPDDLNRRTALVQEPIEPKRHDTVLKKTGVAWFRSGWWKASVSSSGPGCNIPQCSDFSSSLTSYNSCGRSQQHQTAGSPALDCLSCLSDLEVTKSVKVGKSYSWFRKRSSHKAFASCNLPPSCDYRFCPAPPNYCYHRGCGQQNHNRTNPLDCSKVARDPTAKVGFSKWLSWTRLPGQRKKSAPSITTCCVPQYLDSSCSAVPLAQPRHFGCNQQIQTSTLTCPCVNPPGDLTVKTRTAKVQKPSLQSAYSSHEGEITPRKSGVRLSSSIFPRGTCTRQSSVPSMTLKVEPQYLDSSCSPVPPDYPHHLNYNQQNQTSATLSFCPCTPDDLKDKRRRSDVSLSCSLFPRGTCTRQTSVPSIVTREVPQYLDSSCSPVPLDLFRCDGCHQRNQASATSSLRAYPPDDLKVKRRRSGKRISWSLLPSQCKTSLPAISTCSVPRYQDSSTTPVPDHLRTYDLSQQCQTFAYPTPLEHLEETKTRTAKVQKPSIQSLYHEGQTISKETSVTVSWSLLPSTRKISEPSIKTDGLQRTRLHGRSQRTQTPGSLCGYLSYDLKEMRNLSVQVQKPSVEIIRQDRGIHHKNAGVVSDWFRLPSTLMTSVKVPSTLKDRQIIRTSKPHAVALSESNLDPSGQATGSQTFQPDKILATNQIDLREICCLFRKQNPMHLDPAKESAQLPGSNDQLLENYITPLQKNLTSVKTVDQKAGKLISPTKFESSEDSNSLRNEKESKEGILKPNSIALSDSKLAAEKPIDQTLEKNTKELKLVQQKLASIKCVEQKTKESEYECNEDKALSPKEMTTKVANFFVDIKETSIPRINDTLKCLMGLNEPDKSKEDKALSPKEMKAKVEKIFVDIKETSIPRINDTLKCLMGLNEPDKSKEDKALSPKEMKAKVEKIFVDIKETIIPRINDTLKCLMGQNEPDNPEYSRKQRKKTKRKYGKSTGTKGLDGPGTTKQKEQKSKPMSNIDLTSTETTKQKEQEGNSMSIETKDENVEKDASKQLPMRQKRCPPRLPPVIIGLPPVGNHEGDLYEGINPSCKRLDTGVIRRLRSELTHSTSGFKASKRRKLQKSQAEDNIELDFGDAIRYFASMNPERFHQLIQEDLESQRKAEEEKVKEEKMLAEQMKKVRKKTEKEAKKSKVHKHTSIDKFLISADKSETDYPQGLKFSIVKDGPTALPRVHFTKKNR